MANGDGAVTRRRGPALVALALAAAVVGLGLGSGDRASAATAEAPAGASAFVPVTPCRVLDTRIAGGPGTTLTVPVAGACGVPVDASAVVLTLTVPSATAAGFLTAYPAGAPRPTASNLNVVAGSTVANTAVVRLGAGAVTLDSNVRLDKVVDVVGFFRPAATSAAGRYVSVTPRRLLDTRAGAKVPARGTVTATAEGLPADATAVAVNLTFTDTAAAGFFTAYGDGPRPTASTGNADAAGQTRAIFTVVPSSGHVNVFSQTGAHVIVDLVGWFTGPSTPVGVDGLFVPQDPARIVDTRSGAPLASNGVAAVAIGGGAAAWLNVTAIDAVAPGFFTAWATGTPQTGTSTVNASAAHQTVANAAVTALSDRGVSFYAQAGGHLAVDLSGVFVGAPVSTAPAPVDEVIGTSAGGRPIVATHRLDHPGAAHKVLVLGFMHGEEQDGTQVVSALRLAAVPADVDLWLMDTMNPDGGASHQRGNAHGVDLNRNFDGGTFPWCPSPGCGSGASAVDTGSGPLSEPETRAFWTFVNRERFDLIVSYHQPLDTVDCSPTRGATLLRACAAYAAVSGIAVNSVGYIDISGTMTNSYMQANPGKLAFTMEFGPTGVGDVNRHVAAVWAAAAAL